MSTTKTTTSKLTTKQACYILNKIIDDVQALVDQFEAIRQVSNTSNYAMKPDTYQELKRLVVQFISMLEYIKENCDDSKIKEDCDYHVSGIAKTFVFINIAKNVKR